MTLLEMHERLVAWASGEARKDWLLAARQAYFERHGEPHEEDKSFESRMNGLLDWVLYDFRPNGADTVLELFLKDPSQGLTTDELAEIRELSRNHHGLFEVRRIRPGEIRLRDVFTGKDHDVSERRTMAGVAKGDLLEARLLPHAGGLYFSGAFLYHPQEVRKAILAEVKRLRKQAKKGGALDVKGFLASLSRMAFKLERYRNVKIESIYDFAGPSVTLTPRPARPGE
jgi:hypothetical protein